MIGTASLRTDHIISFITNSVRWQYTRHPEWPAWLISLFVWVFYAVNIFASSGTTDQGRVIYCMPAGIIETGHHEVQTVEGEEVISSRMLTTIRKGLVPWILMVAAMMFPLLNEPIRHVAFSVRRKERLLATGGFLIGYCLTWAIAGMFFLLLPIVLNSITGDTPGLLNTIIKCSGFLLAAAQTCLPTRLVIMSKCSQTMPIRIGGLQMYGDSLFYGSKMGIACMKMCWVPMAALLLSNHKIILMCLVTIVIIFERYLLPHTSRLPGYAWIMIAMTIFGVDLLPKLF